MELSAAAVELAAVTVKAAPAAAAAARTAEGREAAAAEERRAAMAFPSPAADVAVATLQVDAVAVAAGGTVETVARAAAVP
mmetsp:Transcript_10230/g.21142  ORF Transcript_10230/g.21142 Transcript_10230/m.21142 type:complete len:81 (-) Transcript_10230:16-258(-)